MFDAIKMSTLECLAFFFVPTVLSFNWYGLVANPIGILAQRTEVQDSAFLKLLYIKQQSVALFSYIKYISNNKCFNCDNLFNIHVKYRYIKMQELELL